MQSDGKSFCGPVVPNTSVKMALWNEDSIVYQIYMKCNYFRIFIMKILNIKVIEENAYLKEIQHSTGRKIELLILFFKIAFPKML